MRSKHVTFYFPPHRRETAGRASAFPPNSSRLYWWKSEKRKLLMNPSSALSHLASTAVCGAWPPMRPESQTVWRTRELRLNWLPLDQLEVSQLNVNMQKINTHKHDTFFVLLLFTELYRLKCFFFCFRTRHLRPPSAVSI